MAAPHMLTIVGDQITSKSPEGNLHAASVKEFVQIVTKSQKVVEDLILPDGVKAVLPMRQGLVVIHEVPPQLHEFKWITDKSAKARGADNDYKTVKVALPYVEVFNFYHRVPNGNLVMSGEHECFFMNKSIQEDGFDSQLMFPALLNVSKLEGIPGSSNRCHAWICTQYLSPAEYKLSLADSKNDQKVIHAGLGALLRHLFESGFNMSSDYSEIASWFTETCKAKIDPRLKDIHTWVEASEKDPLFALEVPWLPVKKTIRQLVNYRIKKQTGVNVEHARDLLRLMLQSKTFKKKAKLPKENNGD